MGIKVTTSDDLTVLDVTGSVSEEEMYNALETFYKQGPTSLLLWDMTQTDVSHVTSDILRKFIRKAAELGKSRQGGRTAVIASEDLQYGLARMSEVFSEMEAAPYHFRAFRTKDDAVEWLSLAEIF